jgi:flagellar protein FliO/FliZ
MIEPASPAGPAPVRRIGVALAAVVAAALPAVARAAAIEPSFAGGLAQTLVGLAVVLALIFGAAWVLRRLNVGASPAGSALRLVASQPLGQRERVVLVEVADQWLVVGVAPGSVTALATLPKGELPPPPAAPLPFASLLARVRRDDTKP